MNDQSTFTGLLMNFCLSHYILKKVLIVISKTQININNIKFYVCNLLPLRAEKVDYLFLFLPFTRNSTLYIHNYSVNTHSTFS